MALRPTVTPCINNNCETLSLTESTGLYSASNTGGFGAPNIDTSSIFSATLTVVTPSGVSTDYDILSQLPAVYVGPFDLDDISISSEDGEYTITYTIITDTDKTYTSTTCYFSSCAVRCCIDTLWAQIAEKELDTVTNCQCDPAKLTKLQDKAMFMEALYMQMMSAASWDNRAVRNKILVQLQRLCRINNCNCGCN